jgi:hypothetical protein
MISSVANRTAAKPIPVAYWDSDRTKNARKVRETRQISATCVSSSATFAATVKINAVVFFLMPSGFPVSKSACRRLREIASGGLSFLTAAVHFRQLRALQVNVGWSRKSP